MKNVIKHGRYVMVVYIRSNSFESTVWQIYSMLLEVKPVTIFLLFQLRNREKQFSESYEGKEEPKPSRSSKLALNTDVSIIDFEIDEDIAIEFQLNVELPIQIKQA